MISKKDIELLNNTYHFMCDFWSELENGYAIKANIAVKDKRLHCCSFVLENYISCFDSTVVKRLKQKNIFPSFSTNMDEFAMGSFSSNDMFEQTRNVYNAQEWSSGGSSGGSAVAVALNTVSFALGSDTGGSVRLPSSYCGISGFKPSYGAISRFGLVAYSSSMDTIGIMAHDVSKIEEIFNIIKGYDDNDMQTLSIDMQKLRNKNTVAYISSDLLQNICSPEILDCYKNYISFLKNDFDAVELESVIGKHMQNTLVNLLEEAAIYYYDIACVEAFSNLKRFNGLRYMNNDIDTYSNLMQKTHNKFSKNVQYRISKGEQIMKNSQHLKQTNIYLSSFNARNKLISFMNILFSKINVLCTPTNISHPILLHSKMTSSADSYLTPKEDMFLSFINIAGLCSVTIKAADYKGIQLISARGDDDNCLSVASQIQQSSRKQYNESF